MADFPRAVMWGCGIVFGVALAILLLTLGTCAACTGAVMVASTQQEEQSGGEDVSGGGGQAVHGHDGSSLRERVQAVKEQSERERTERLAGMPEAVRVVGRGRVSLRPGEVLLPVDLPGGMTLHPLDQEFVQSGTMPPVRYWQIKIGDDLFWISEHFTDQARSFEEMEAGR